MADFVTPSTQREFRCSHCDGKILIPRDLPPTTAPCPHCSSVITSPALELPQAPVQSFQVPVEVPAPPPAIPAVPAAIPVQGSAPPMPPAPVAAVPTVVTSPDLPPVVIPTPQEEPPPLPPATVLKPDLVSKEIPAASAEPAKKVPLVQAAQAAKPPKQRSGLIPAMLILLVLIIAGGAAFYLATQEFGKNIEPPVAKSAAGDPAANEAAYIRIGWQKDAYQVLSGYMAATETKTKIPYLLDGARLESRIEGFYGGGTIIDSDTPAEAFSVYELSEEDRKRGLFMMIYDQPPQFEMKEFFRPLASLEVQYGIDEADLLLSTLARVGNFAMEPLRVHAFFKRTPEGLKLDWEIFAQTKYRTFQNFVELPEAGQTGIFRIFIVEDVPDKGRAVSGTRTYRLVDPANTGDIARVNVKVDSEMGRALSIINWRGTKENRPITRTCTVELKWAGEAASPELEIHRFICWEFLGLGGQESPSTAAAN